MLERKGNVLFNDALNTFYLWLYGYNKKRSLFDVNILSSGSFNGCLGCFTRMLEWKGKFLFNDALNTFYLQLYGYNNKKRSLFDVNTLSSGSFNGCLACFMKMLERKGKECFYLTMHSTHFIYSLYGYNNF